MSPTITVASFSLSFFVRPQNVCVVDTFSTELLNYWTGKRKRIQVNAKGPPFRVLNFQRKIQNRTELQDPHCHIRFIPV